MSSSNPKAHLRGTAEDIAQSLRDSVALADRYVIADIESLARESGRTPNGRRVYDLRPLLDPREQCCQTLDMMSQAVRYAYARGLIAPAADHLHVVVILKAEGAHG